MNDASLALFWFRRDLRLHDNAGLYHALGSGWRVQPVFLFDPHILEKLNNPLDRRVSFLHNELAQIKARLRERGSDLWIVHQKPEDFFREALRDKNVKAVFTNHDDEPSARARDQKIADICQAAGVTFKTFKDQVIFERDEIKTDAGKPYTVYTPYKKKWLASLSSFYLKSYPSEDRLDSLAPAARERAMPTLESMGFQKTDSALIPPTAVSLKVFQNYAENRDWPARPGTSRLGIHLRFGTISVRNLARMAKEQSAVYLSELIWREFFMQILYHFPHAVESSFRPEYEKVPWRFEKTEFERWRVGETGYPLVDAGMRELNQTGFMHNRVRMVCASFLTKHLLHHWSHGERAFARELLDYELAANNGNWQWAAGTGCDAAPYFRIFNPASQLEKFDSQLVYVRKWVPEYGTSRYPAPMVDHAMARARALDAFKGALKGAKQ